MPVRRKKTVVVPAADDQARDALERLTKLTDRLEATTLQLAEVVKELRRQGADHA